MEGFVQRNFGLMDPPIKSEDDREKESEDDREKESEDDTSEDWWSWGDDFPC